MLVERLKVNLFFELFRLTYQVCVMNVNFEIWFDIIHLINTTSISFVRSLINVFISPPWRVYDHKSEHLLLQ